MTYVGMIVCNTLLAVLQEQETIRTVHQCSYRNEQVVTLLKSSELCSLGCQVIYNFPHHIFFVENLRKIVFMQTLTIGFLENWFKMDYLMDIP